MLRRLFAGDIIEIISCKRSTCVPRRWSIPTVHGYVQHSVRGLCEANAAQRSDGDSLRHRLPGTPAPGREQTLGEAFAAMQHHARGTRKVKANVLYKILERVSSVNEVKYAQLGLEIFKNQGIKLSTKAGSLFIKACCKAGSPQAAVDALEKAEKYGLHEESVVSPHRFNYLLSQLYRAGDEESFHRAVAEGGSRPHMLNARSHLLIDKFEAEVRARREEEEAEEDRLRQEEEDKAKVEAEKAKANQETDGANVNHEVEEDKAKQDAGVSIAEQGVEGATSTEDGENKATVLDAR